MIMLMKIKLSTIKIGHIFLKKLEISGKKKLLLNLTENQPDIDKIYLYAQDPYEAKYQYLTLSRLGGGLVGPQA